jgi:putative ABC transport system permease protein
MGQALPSIPLTSLLIGFGPIVVLLILMRRWSLDAPRALYANARMLAQLLLVGYVLTYIFEAEGPVIILAVVAVMILASSWIALRPKQRVLRMFLVVVAAIAATGVPMLFLVTQIVLEMPRWFEPSVVIPLAGMIFATAMNTVSLAADRFEAEKERDADYPTARRTALDAALIPQTNTLFAVGLVSLPGMMTGQILSGVDPLIAARYQIMVMWMLFGTGGFAAALYLVQRRY